MKAAKKTMLMDGAKVAYTHGQYGKNESGVIIRITTTAPGQASGA